MPFFKVQASDNIYEFSYTGDYQIFTVPKTGVYKIELWGAAGGKNMVNGAYTGSYVFAGGLGAYTSGEILLNEGTKLYVYVGGIGQNALNAKDTPGGYNGGGNGTHDHGDNESSAGGGGATDIRLTAGVWNDLDSLKSRIMVAGGGGGASYGQAGGYGGALTGGNTPYSSGGTQTTGYQFGIGENGIFQDTQVDVAGGGGGYFGGEANSSGIANTYLAAGAGGSSFVSGGVGCIAIHPTSTQNKIVFTAGSIHYSHYKFDNIVMKAGNEEMPTFDGTATMTGNASDGYAQITFVRTVPLLYDLEVENAQLIQEVTEGNFTYDVVIPSETFTTNINYLATVHDLLVLGVENVTLKQNTPHYISLTDYKTGEVVVYTLNPRLEKPSAESIQFAEIPFEFKKSQYQYSDLEVDYSISTITPIVVVNSDKSYQLLSSTALSVGNNIFKIEVSDQNGQKVVYQFTITRLPFENAVSEFPFTGSYQEWTAPLDGYYSMELWGAAGGRGRTNYTLNKF
ncbi:MAG: glycine rich domain-containing protein, partial [bacterium]|nr:glycine rich domain-containing protein [bacterium]